MIEKKAENRFNEKCKSQFGFFIKKNCPFKGIKK